MKKLLFLLFAGTGFLHAHSQSEKYMTAMTAYVQALDTSRSMESLQSLANSFERIGEAEKNQWLPFYYASLAQVNAGYFLTGGKTGVHAEKIDALADKAEQLLLKAEGLTKANDEIFIIKKMIATLRMMADPMSRYMQYGPIAQQALQEARRINPDNPRIYLLEGQDKFHTPEQYGGSKEEARKLFILAKDKFDASVPKSFIEPHWGRNTTEYFLNQLQ